MNTIFFFSSSSFQQSFFGEGFLRRIACENDTPIPSFLSLGQENERTYLFLFLSLLRAGDRCCGKTLVNVLKCVFLSDGFVDEKGKLPYVKGV